MHRIPSNANRVPSKRRPWFFPPTDFLNYGGPGVDGVGAGPLAPLKWPSPPHARAQANGCNSAAISPIYFADSPVAANPDLSTETPHTGRPAAAIRDVCRTGQGRGCAGNPIESSVPAMATAGAISGDQNPT